jgi:hypothetical protein
LPSIISPLWSGCISEDTQLPPPKLQPNLLLLQVSGYKLGKAIRERISRNFSLSGNKRGRGLPLTFGWFRLSWEDFVFYKSRKPSFEPGEFPDIVQQRDGNAVAT